MIIIIAVLGLVVVNAMKDSIWATSTVAATVPIAMLVGIYMTHLRPGRVLEASIIGVVLVMLAVIGGRYVAGFSFGQWFEMDAPHRYLEVVAASQPHGRDHILCRRTSGDDDGFLVDHRVPDGPGVVISGLPSDQDIAGEGPTELFRECSRRPLIEDCFRHRHHLEMVN